MFLSLRRVGDGGGDRIGEMMLNICLMNLVKATLVYVTDGDRTLMIHRVRKAQDLHAGKYNGLGGKLEEGETPWECAIREVKEESNLDISELKFKGHLLFPKFDGQGRDWLVFVYRAHRFSNVLVAENREGVLEWVANDQLLALNLWPGDRLFLPYIHTEHTFDGKLFYKDGVLDKTKEQLIRTL